MLAFLESGPAGEVPLESRDPGIWGTLFEWAIVRRLGKILAQEDFAEHSRAWIDEWLLGKISADVLRRMGVSEGAARQQVALARLFTLVPGFYLSQEAERPATAAAALRAWLEDPQVQGYLNIHRYQDILWFNQEAFERLCWWAFVISIVQAHAALDGAEPESGALCKTLLACYRLAETLLSAAKASGFQVEKLLGIVEG
jgi:hypothetical protein